MHVVWATIQLSPDMKIINVLSTVGGFWVSLEKPIKYCSQYLK